MVTLFSNVYPRAEIQKAEYYSYFLTIRNGSAVSLAPADHALFFPIAFDCTSRTVLKGEANFFNRVILDNYQEDNIIPKDRLVWRSSEIVHPSAILINCLDNCYGHALLKMLTLLLYYKKFGHTHDFVVVVPKIIAHHIRPLAGTHICEVDIGFQEAEKCYRMTPVIDFVRKNYKAYDFALPGTYPTFETQDEVIQFFDWFGGAPPRSGESKCDVVFYYRSDFFRTWGGRRQKKNIVELLSGMRPFFTSAAKFYILGDLDGHTFPDWIDDRRVRRHTKNTDFLYNQIYANAILVIGLTGSNMLCPSLLSGMTVHLVPTQKIRNTAEDILRFRSDTIEAQYRNVYLYLDDLGFKQKGRKLVDRILSLMQATLEKDFKLRNWDFSTATDFNGQKSYILSSYKQINYAALSAYNANVMDQSFRRVLARWRLHRATKLLSGFAMNSSEGHTVPRAKT